MGGCGRYGVGPATALPMKPKSLMLGDGPDLDVLRTLCERYRPVMFLLSSVLHNPTGTSIAPHKARKLIELAAEFDMLLGDGIDAMPVARRMLGKGYLTAPGDHFSRGGRHSPDMRFNVTTTNAGAIEALVASL